MCGYVRVGRFSHEGRRTRNSASKMAVRFEGCNHLGPPYEEPSRERARWGALGHRHPATPFHSSGVRFISPTAKRRSVGGRGGLSETEGLSEAEAACRRPPQRPALSGAASNLLDLSTKLFLGRKCKIITLEGSFSALPKPVFASKQPFCSV